MSVCPEKDPDYETGVEDVEVDAFLPGKSKMGRIVVVVTRLVNGVTHNCTVREEKERLLECHVPNPDHYVMRMYFVDDGRRLDLRDEDQLIYHTHDLAQGGRGHFVSFDLRPH